jgi:DNA replication protein DnaC
MINRRPLEAADLNRILLPKRYWESNLNVIPDEMEYKKIVKWILADMDDLVRKGRIIVLMGPPNSGKTSLASIVLKEAMRRGKLGMFIDASEYGSVEFRNQIYEDDQTIEGRSKEIPFLVLDNLGREERGECKIEELIKRRWEEKKVTIITTPLNEEGIVEKYGKPMMEMLERSAYIIEVKGIDYGEIIKKKLQEEVRNGIKKIEDKDFSSPARSSLP